MLEDFRANVLKYPVITIFIISIVLNVFGYPFFKTI